MQEEKIENISVDTYFKLAYKNIQENKLNEATKIYQRMIDEQKDEDVQSVAHQGLGHIYYEQKKIEDAKQQFKQAYELYSNAEVCIAYLAFLIHQRREFTEIMPVFNKILSIYSNDASIQENFSSRYSIIPHLKLWNVDNPQNIRNILFSILRMKMAYHMQIQEAEEVKEIENYLRNILSHSTQPLTEQNQNFLSKKKQLQQIATLELIRPIWIELLKGNMIQVIQSLLPPLEKEFPNDIVCIYYWKPYVTRNRNDKIGVGHVSLQTTSIYASFWPEVKPDIYSCYQERGEWHEDLEADIRAEGSQERTGMPDDIVYIPGFSPQKINNINQYFRENKADYWSLCSVRNCSGMVANLLDEGGIKDIVKEFRSSLSIRNLDNIKCKSLTLYFIAFTSLGFGISNFNPYSTIIASLLIMVPFMSFWNYWDNRKKNNFELNADSFTSILCYVLSLLGPIGIVFYTEQLLDQIENPNLKTLTFWAIFFGSISVTFYTSRKLFDFLFRCCFFGTDFIIRPAGTIKLAKYAAQMARVTPRVQGQVNFLQLGLCPIFFSFLLTILNSSISEVRGYLSAATILQPLYAQYAWYRHEIYYESRYFKYDEDSKQHWHDGETPSLITAESDFLYFNAASKEILNSSFFLAALHLGIMWGSWGAATFFQPDNLFTQGLTVGAGGLVSGLLLSSIVYLSINYIRKSPKITIQREADETKRPLLQENKVSISQFAASGRSLYSSVEPVYLSEFQTSDQRLEEDKELQQGTQDYSRPSKYSCLIL